MSNQHTEQPPRDLTSDVARLSVELTGLRYWVRRMYCEGWRHNPRAGVDLVRGHMAAARRSKPPLSDVDTSDQVAILQAFSVEIDRIGEEIVADLSELPRSVVPQIRPDGALDVGALLQVIEGLARTAQAQEWWLGQCYFFAARGQAGRMAQMIRMKMDSAQNEPPMGPKGMPADQLDASWLEELPGVMAVGHNLAAMLEATQHGIDEARARAASDTAKKT